MTLHVSAVFDSHDQAASAVRALKEHQFTERELSVVAKADDAGASETKHGAALEQENARGGAWTGSALGAAVAGTVGLLSMALIPAVPLLVVGGAAIGGLAGNVLGGLGLGEHQLHETEAALRAGGVLVVVHQETKERAQLAKDLLARAQPRGVSMTS